MSSDNEKTTSVNKIISEDYIDLIVEYYGNVNFLEKFGEENYTIIDEVFAMVHIPSSDINLEFIKKYGWTSFAYVGGLMDASSLEESGITKLQSIPKLNIKGDGVLIGVVDTGIEYTHSAFRYEDNTTKIVSIWDQTIQNSGKEPEGFQFGTEYTREEINKALLSSNPLSIVPSTDVNGHGTMMAGIAAGLEIEKEDFVGVVPNAELVIVKMKEAKKNIRRFFLIPDNEVAYQTPDYFFGVQYLMKVAQKLNRPIAIGIGVGTSQGAHDGRGVLARYLNLLAQKIGTAIVLAAGNEGNQRSHCSGIIDKKIGYDVVELKVGENEKGFCMELVGAPPNVYSVDILSPSGEFIPRIQAKMKENREIQFLFENTTLFVHFQILDEQTGNERVLFRFINPAQGIWRFRIYSTGNLTMSYHIWLPIQQYIGKDTYFIESDPYTTIVSPGNTYYPITATAYNHTNKTLYTDASRGFTSLNLIKPDIAAPGVGIKAPALNNSFDVFTATSVATAHVAGIAAMLLEWGIVGKNIIDMDTQIIKRILIDGAKRDPNLTYPNRDWGYGIVDVYNSFLRLRGE